MEAASEPAPGSDKEKHGMTSPEAILGSHSFFK